MQNLKKLIIKYGRYSRIKKKLVETREDVLLFSSIVSC